uniref:Kazal-like domain-containing protein n=1 Tax=Sus scrofa TaxID=9823 RepID=A0A8D0ZUG5_PIG
MEVPRPGVESELQLPAYATATATPDLSLICDLHHSSRQHRLLNPLSKARDQTCNLTVPSQIHFRCTTRGTPLFFTESGTSVSEIISHGELFLLTYCACTLFAGIFKRRDYSRWPEPPCEMYYPWGPRRDSICPDVTAHVCATNGETYKNECFFCLDHWEFGPYVQFYKYGKCK